MIEEYNQMMTKHLEDDGYREVPYGGGTIYVKEQQVQSLSINDFYGIMEVEGGDLLTIVVDGKRYKGIVESFVDGMYTLDCNGTFMRHGFISVPPTPSTVWTHPGITTTITDNSTWATTTGNTVTVPDASSIGAANTSAGWERRSGVSGPGLTALDGIMTGTIHDHAITSDMLAHGTDVTVMANGITLTTYPSTPLDHIYLTNRVVDTDGDLVAVNLNGETPDEVPEGTVRTLTELFNNAIRGPRG